MTFVEKAETLVRANARLERDLENIAQQVCDFDQGHLIWAATYREIRHDAWIGVIKKYFRESALNNPQPLIMRDKSAIFARSDCRKLG